MGMVNSFEKAVQIVDKYGKKKILFAILSVSLFASFTIGIPYIVKATVEHTMKDIDTQRELAHIKNINHRRTVQPQIYSTLDALLTSTKSDRAYIIELHNGSQNLNGVPYLHGTVVYERTKDGVEAIDEEYQNLSLSRYEFSTYLHDNFSFVGSIDELEKIDKKIASKLRANEVSYVATTTLHNGGREWGWFGVLYSEGSEIPSKETIMKALGIHAQSISMVLKNVD